MKKIYLSFVILLLKNMMAFSQEMLINTNIQDWAAQSSSGTYTQNIDVQGSTKVIKITDCYVQPAQSAPGTGLSNECSKGRINCTSNKGIVEFPELNNIGFIRINATTGSNDRSFALEKKNGSNWDLLESFTTQNTCGRFTYVLNALGTTTLRIRSNTGSSLYIWDIYVESMPSQGPLQINGISPANNQTGVAVNPQFEITFNKNVVKGSGNISVSESGTATLIEAVSVDNIIIEGKTASFRLTNPLVTGKAYYVSIPATAIKDINGNFFAGILSDTQWCFTTRSTLSSEKNILSLQLPGQQGTTRFPSDRQIEIDVKYGTPNVLVPAEFILSDAASLAGATINDAINISSTVVFVVKAEDGTTKTWTLKVNKLKNTAADITKFEIERGVAAINTATTTIDATIWGYSDLNNLLPSVILSANAQCDVNLTVPADFTIQKQYIVTSEDGQTAKTWKVNVKMLQPAATPITYEGPWKTMNRQGWIAYNLGDDDSKTGSEPNGAANLASQGSFVMIHFDLIPEQMDYRFRPTGSSGDMWEGKMEIQVSASGQYWETVKTHEDLIIPSSTNCASQIPVTLDDTVKFARLILTGKPAVGGSAIVDGITITPKHIRANYYPENNEVGVPLNIEPVITFDTPITKINGSELPSGLSNIKLIQKNNTNTVNANVSINQGKNRVTITPTTALSLYATYQIVIEGIVEAENGIKENFPAVEFRTEASAGDSNKEITSFSIAGQIGNAGIDKASRTITVNVNDDIDVKKEVPIISINGNSYRLMWNFGGKSCPQYYEVTANDGTTAEWKIIFSTVGGNTEMPFVNIGKTNFVIYPNPVTDNVIVNSSSRLKSVRVYNSLGIELKKVDVNAMETDIDVSGLASGAYIVNGTSVTGEILKSILIKK